MNITRSDVEHVAKLAKLKLTEEEKTAYQEKLDAILQYMQQLQELDTTGVAPTTHVLPLENVMRQDEVGVCLPREKALSNAPEPEDGYFRVPRIM